MKMEQTECSETPAYKIQFCLYLVQFFLEWEMIQKKKVVKKIKQIF
jgi:hypothetical protein